MGEDQNVCGNCEFYVQDEEYCEMFDEEPGPTSMNPDDICCEEFSHKLAAAVTMHISK